MIFITINTTIFDVNIYAINVSNATTLSMTEYTDGEWTISTTAASLGCNQNNSNCTLTFTAIDLAGNENSTTTMELVIDDTNPEIHSLLSNDTDNVTRNDS